MTDVMTEIAELEARARAKMGASSPSTCACLFPEHCTCGAARVASLTFDLDPKTGLPVCSQHNIITALAKLGVRLSYNLLAESEIIERGGQRDVLQDHHVNALWLEIDREFTFRANVELFRTVVSDLARRASYHPVRDYLASVEPIWDGTKRAEDWLIRLAGAKDTPFVRAVSRIVLVAAVRRARRPGCKFDELLVLESVEQGTNKTSAVEALCPDPTWFGDDVAFDAETKRQMEAMEGCWIIEAGELKGMRRADHRKLKSFLSKRRDKSRMAYGRKSSDRPRQCIFIGTTNDKEYLKDNRNRRYWPVEVVRFDLDALRAERDQLWAEAAHLESTGESIRLDPTLWGEAADEQSERRSINAIEVRLEPFADLTGKVLIADVWRVAGFENQDPGEDIITRIGEVMRDFGWERKQRKAHGERQNGWHYVRGTKEEQMLALVVNGSKHTGWSIAAVTPVTPSVIPRGVTT